MIRALTTVGLLLAFLLTAIPARADDVAQAFGDKGEIIVSGDRLMGLFDYTSFKASSNTMGVTTSTSVNFTSIALLQNPSSSVLDVPANTPRLSLDYTVIPHLTIGGSAVVYFNPGANTTTKESGMGVTTSSTVAAPTVTLLGIQPRAGYIIGFNRFLSFWPRGGLSFYWLQANTPATGMGSSSTKDTFTAFQINLEPMFVLTPATHVGLTAGPTVDIPIVGTTNESVTDSTGKTVSSPGGNLTLFHLGIEVGLFVWF